MIDLPWRRVLGSVWSVPRDLAVRLRSRGRGGWRGIVLEQVLAAEDSFAAMETYISKPSPESVALAGAARERARSLQKALAERWESEGVRSEESAEYRQNRFLLSRRIEELARWAKEIVDGMAALALGPREGLDQLGRPIRLGCQELARAWRLSTSRPRRATEHVLSARSAFARAAAGARRAWTVVAAQPAGAAEAPRWVQDLKARDLYRRFSDAAECGGQAADLMGDLIIRLL